MDSGSEHDRPGQEPREIFILRDNDPLDVQQAIMRYLRKQGRESIDHVEDLCRVISSTCLSTFDYHDTPEGYHFFDIFESAIGLVVSLLFLPSNYEYMSNSEIDGSNCGVLP